jgi:hypothetical protein
MLNLSKKCTLTSLSAEALIHPIQMLDVSEGVTMTRFASVRASVIGAAVLCAGIGAFPSVSLANLDGTYQITSTNFGFDCSASCGTVAIAGDTTKDITFAIDITAANLAIHGIGNTFSFSVSPDSNPTPTVTITGNNGTAWASSLTTGVNGSQDGFGKFNDSVNCAGGGTSNACGTTVTIDLKSTSNLTLANSSAGFPFSITLIDTSANGGTGFGSVPGPVLGAGLPGLLAACGVLVMLGRRRRSEQIA